MSKAPVTGIVAHVSKRGTEVRLNGDPKRYRGVKLRPSRQIPGCKTMPVFKYAGVQVGDEVYLKWGGFADMNIEFAYVLTTMQQRYHAVHCTATDHKTCGRGR